MKIPEDFKEEIREESHLGKILYLDQNWNATIHSSGHRNPQGLVINQRRSFILFYAGGSPAQIFALRRRRRFLPSHGGADFRPHTAAQIFVFVFVLVSFSFSLSLSFSVRYIYSTALLRLKVAVKAPHGRKPFVSC